MTTPTASATSIPLTAAGAANGNNHKPTVVFTTPSNYATRLSHLLTLKNLTPLWCPTITTSPTPQTLSSLSLHLSPHSSLSLLTAVTFPSRAAICAVSAAMSSLPTPLLPTRTHNTLIFAALGKDAELLNTAFLLSFCDDINRIRVLVPQTATPSGLVKALGPGFGKRVLCPVPRFVDLQEPLVVREFLREFEDCGWVPVRVDAYETRWVGPRCAEGIVGRCEEGEEGGVDALVFTSAAEVEGMLKGLKELGWDWGELKRRWPEMVVAAHGPVTADGAERLGVEVDVVSERFGSFEGVVDALCLKLNVNC